MNPRAIAAVLTMPRLFSLLVATLAILAVLYMYFLTSSVMQVVLRKEAVEEGKRLRSEIAQLEAQYIEAQHTISERVATISTFTATSDKVFIDRSAPALVMNTNASY